MTRYSRLVPILGLSLLLAGCASGWPRPLGLFNRAAESPANIEVPADDPAADAPEAGEAPPETGVPSITSGVFGITVASLGDPTDPGLWLETPLVSSETPGRVVTETGQTAAVTLRPSGGPVGSGSRISLAAMQLLGLSLTDLVTLTVSAGS